MNPFVFDMEGNGLIHNFNRMFEYHHVTKVWCAAGRVVDSGIVYTWRPDDIEDFIKFIDTQETIVGHNIINYDLRVLNMLYGYTYTGKVIDTLILSKYLHPERHGGHSIEAWGERIGIKKPEHEDWSQFSDEMLHRCAEDTRINETVYTLLIEEASQRKWEVEGVQLWAA